MKNCLVTQLKAEINNPNLPFFETMQQFTLDAIAASANSAMTDAQKWALNHFFFQIGAIRNTPTWQKIKGLIIPVICADNINKVAVNYVDNTTYSAPSGSFTSNHGYYGNQCRINNYVDNRIGLSCLYIPDVPMNVAAGCTILGTTSEGDYLRVDYNSSQNVDYISFEGHSRYTVKALYSGIWANSIEGKVSYGLLTDGEITNSEHVQSISSAALSNLMFINGTEDYGAALGIIGYDLTKDELNSLMLASRTLVDAFTI